MTITPLQAKTQIPLLRKDAIDRQALMARLDSGLNAQIILVSAPAGYGKTTLVAQWLNHIELKSIWVSLDEQDNYLTNFLSHLIAALQRQLPEGFNDLAGLLYTPQLPETDALAALFLNTFERLNEKIIIVLDDVQFIENTAIRQLIEQLVAQQKDHIQWVIITRRDPSLPLSRLRARGQLAEIRGSDLQFNNEEAEAFLSKSMNLTLNPAAVTKLNDRTEGWIAGLQLAALSLQNMENPEDFINCFSGDNRHIMDFLLDEVLENQSQEVYDFLLKTSILNRFNASLCDFVRSSEEQTISASSDLIQTLDQSNLFLHPLDNTRSWYRYHRLFSDLLSQVLHRTLPELVPELHMRASIWFDKNGYLEEAVRHAFKAKDPAMAARLIMKDIDPLWLSGKANTLFSWLQQLPQDVLDTYPRLKIYTAWLHYYLFWQVDEAEDNLSEAENDLCLQKDLFEVDKNDLTEETRNTVGQLAQIRSTIILNKENSSIEDAKKWSQLALKHLGKENHIWLSFAYLILGFTQNLSGQSQEALESLKQSEKMARRAAFPQHLITIRRNLALIEMMQGNLQQAQRLFMQIIEQAQAQSLSYSPAVAVSHLDLATILINQNKLAEAEQHARRCIELGEAVNRQPNVVLGYLALAIIREARDDYDEALSFIKQAENIAQTREMTNMLPAFESQYARLDFAQGKMERAIQWVHQCVPEGTDFKKLNWQIPNNWLEPEPLFIALTLIREGRYEDAEYIINSIQESAQRMNQMAHLIESYILQSISAYHQEQNEVALNALQTALGLAKPRGYLLFFLNKGNELFELLNMAAQRDIHPDFVEKLLSTSTDRSTIKQSEQISNALIIEPLSQRELEVLELIAEGLSNDEIADRLVLSLHTIKTHTRHIYNKLGVSKRTQAVAEARRLGIL